MSALIEDLYARGLDRRVLFLFCGEFGRTPRIAESGPLAPSRPRSLAAGDERLPRRRRAARWAR